MRQRTCKCIEEKRVNVSASFFLSIEFQETGYLRYLLEKESFGSLPKYAEFMRDLQEVGRGVIVNSPGWEQKLKDNQQQFADSVGERGRRSKPLTTPLSNADYVNALYANAGIVAAAGGNAIHWWPRLDTASESRASILLDVAGKRGLQTDRNTTRRLC